MAEQREIVQELMNRIDSLPESQRSVVMELGNRFGVGPPAPKMKLPAGLSHPRVPGEDPEAMLRYQQAYGQEPPPGYPHNLKGSQGLDELGGALMMPAFRGVLAAPSLSVAAKELGKSALAMGRSTVTGAVAGYATEELASRVLPKKVAVAAGIIAGLYGAAASSKVGPYLDAEKGTPTIGKFLKWAREQSKKAKPRRLQPPPSRTPQWAGEPPPSVARPPLFPDVTPATTAKTVPPRPATPTKAAPKVSTPPAASLAQDVATHGKQMAKSMKSFGITPEEAEGMTMEEWKMAAQGSGVPFSEEAKKWALQELKYSARHRKGLPSPRGTLKPPPPRESQ